MNERPAQARAHACAVNHDVVKGSVIRATRLPSAAFALFSTIVLSLTTFAPAHAQEVRGTLVQQRAGRVVPGAQVSLLDARGAVLDSVRSSSTGTFTLRASRAGEYFLYFTHPGYASVPSNPIELKAGETLEYRFAVPLVSGVALRRMAEVINVEARLQSNLTELCGERPRADEAGILIGVVRRRGGEPLSGALVRVIGPGSVADRFEKATVSSANGVYVICNVPPGSVATRTELIGFHSDEGPADIRAGEIAWYDMYLTAR